MSPNKLSANPSPRSSTSLDEGDHNASSALLQDHNVEDHPSRSSEYRDSVTLHAEPTSPNEDANAKTSRDRRAQGLVLDTNVQASESLPPIDETEQAEIAKSKPVSWSSLPRKDQLLVLTLARLSEPLTQTSLGSYIFYQLKSFNPSLPDSTIASQVGVIHAAFPAAQFFTAILWGRFADSPYGGRKRVLYIGLLGSMLSILGFGFSHSFPMAVCFRLLGGILNGNIGVMRTMISEIVKEKKYQSRAFLILPMTFNIGVIIGPILGGILADPVGSYPSIFGPDSPLGGKNGVEWMKRWPYALPNMVNAVFLFTSACAVLFFLEETSELTKHKPDPMLHIGHWILRHVFRRRAEDGYTAIPTEEPPDVELQRTPVSPISSRHFPPADKPSLKRVLPFRRIWTRNLTMTLCSHALLAMHVGTFNSLWFIFLSTPRYDPDHPNPKNFKPHGLHFTGGLALPPPRIGLALAILGTIGITLQLFVYPNLSHRLGTVRAYRLFLMFFPLTYALVPFLSIIPSWAKPPAPVSGPLVWIGITCVLFIQVLARTFALPCAAILINNSSPHPTVLGTVHGIGQSVSSLSRMFSPVLFGWLFGRGLDLGFVALAWWVLAGVAVVGSIVGRFLFEGDGHEILLEGEVKGEDGEVRGVGR